MHATYSYRSTLYLSRIWRKRDQYIVSRMNFHRRVNRHTALQPNAHAIGRPPPGASLGLGGARSEPRSEEDPPRMWITPAPQAARLRPTPQMQKPNRIRNRPLTDFSWMRRSSPLTSGYGSWPPWREKRPPGGEMQVGGMVGAVWSGRRLFTDGCRALGTSCERPCSWARPPAARSEGASRPV